MDNNFQSLNNFESKLPVKINYKLLMIAGAVAILLLVSGVGLWFWSKSNQIPEASSLGGVIFDKTQNSILGQVPDINPFKNQKNPLDVIYKNPFE